MENVPSQFCEAVAATIGRLAVDFDASQIKNRKWASAMADRSAERRDYFNVYVQLTPDLCWRYYCRRDPTLCNAPPQQLLMMENYKFEDLKRMDPKTFQFASLDIQSATFPWLPDPLPAILGTVLYKEFIPFILKHSNSWTFSYSLNLNERYRNSTEKMLRAVERRPFEACAVRYGGAKTEEFVRFQLSQRLAALELNGFWPPTMKSALAAFISSPYFEKLELAQECDITMDFAVFETMFELFVKGSAFTKLYLRCYIRAPFVTFESYRKDMQVAMSPGNEVMWRNPLTNLTFLLMENDKGRGYRFIVGKD